MSDRNFNDGFFAPSRQPPQRRKRHFLAYKRRWIVWGGMFILLGGIGVYQYLTKPARVKAIVESELSSLLHSPVTVDYAAFSIARGLVLQGVTVYGNDAKTQDSVILTAARVAATVDYSKLLRLSPELSEVQAREVRLFLVEDVPTSTWNIDRLFPKSGHPQKLDESQTLPASPPKLPLTQLSDAVVRYCRKTGETTELAGEVRIEASITPMDDHRVGFNMMTEPGGNARRTNLYGVLDRASGEVAGQLSEVNITPAVRDMLPDIIGNWFHEFDFAGKFSLPAFRYKFATATAPEEFEITLRFADTRAIVRPQQWLNARERWNMGVLRQSIRTFDMAGLGRPMKPADAVGEASESLVPLDTMSWLQHQTWSVPLTLKNVNGTVLFTQSQVNVQNVTCQVQDQELEISGQLKGYSGESPMNLSVHTPLGKYLAIPPSRRFMTWLPDDVRKAYLQFRPRGKATVDVRLNRETSGGAITPEIIVAVSDTTIQFEDFPYPLERCNGQFIFRHDPGTNQDLLFIKDLFGHGTKGGPNENCNVYVNGAIGPFIKGGPGVNINVIGTGVNSEPSLRESMPPEVARELLQFGPPDYGARVAANGGKPVELTPEESLHWPEFAGSFDVTIHRDAGPRKSVDTTLKLDLAKANGAYKPFPYPMHAATATLKIHDDQLDIVNLTVHNKGGTLLLNGSVPFDDMKGGVYNPVKFLVDAREVPIDADLLNALPATERGWIQRAALGGRVNIDGTIFSTQAPGKSDSDIAFDLNLRLHDATLMRDAIGPAITALNGDARLQPARLDFRQLDGRRGDATIGFSGTFAWKDGTDLQLKLSAKDLLLDQTLRDILPSEPAKQAWDAQKPEGTTDLDLDLSIHTAPEDGPVPSTHPADHMLLTLHPIQLSATPDVFPLHLSNIKGQIIVDDRNVRLDNVTANYKDATLSINADGITEPLDFRIKASGANLSPDASLLAALPGSVSDVIKGTKASGKFAVRFDKLNLRQAASPRRTPVDSSQPPLVPATTTAPAARAAMPPLDVDFDCAVSATDATVDPGVAVTGIYGGIQLAGDIRSNDLTRLEGSLDVRQYSVLGRKGSDLSATLRRPAYSRDLLVQSLKSKFAGGNIAGDVTLVSHDQGPSQYSVRMVVQNASLAEVFGSAVSNPANATFSASFDVEGVSNDPNSRRGGGNIEIRGKDMVEAPIVLGFFRMVNLSLPVSGGVNQVNVTYTLQRDKAVLDNLELRSPGLRMYGDGVLDFSRNEINLTLNTENPDRLPLPLLNKVAKRVREELLQIKIKGSMNQPQVQAVPFPTFQATLGEVVADINRGQKK